mmetsp:Transcript_52969/g.98482  ORF Transcript_52969/g.98482 Transcript_52969/m.98482 type:complete len:273 (+) Transcript_52969:331-1149(+)
MPAATPPVPAASWRNPAALAWARSKPLSLYLAPLRGRPFSSHTSLSCSVVRFSSSWCTVLLSTHRNNSPEQRQFSSLPSVARLALAVAFFLVAARSLPSVSVGKSLSALLGVASASSFALLNSAPTGAFSKRAVDSGLLRFDKSFEEEATSACNKHSVSLVEAGLTLFLTAHGVDEKVGHMKCSTLGDAFGLITFDFPFLLPGTSPIVLSLFSVPFSKRLTINDSLLFEDSSECTASPMARFASLNESDEPVEVSKCTTSSVESTESLDTTR